MKYTEQSKIAKIGGISGRMVKNNDSSSVALALINVNNELQKLETKDKNKTKYSDELLNKIKKIYDDLIKMLHKYPQFPSEVIDHQDLNLFYPLMKLISINLARGQDVNDLTDKFGMLIWHHLNHPVLFRNLMKLLGSRDTIMKQFCELILEIVPKIQKDDFLYAYWYTRKVTDGPSEDVRDEWYAISMGFVKLITENIEEWYNVFLELECMCKISSFTKDDNKKLTDLLVLLIEGFGAPSKKELLALMISTMGLVENLESLSQQEISSINKRCISKVVETVRNTLIWNDPCLISTKKVMSALSKTSSISIKLDPKHSILFILEILDHGNDFNYLHTYNLLSYLTMSLRNLNNLLLYGKQNLYLHYNQLNSKISLTALLANLNYIISSSLLSIYSDNEEIPDIISDNFNQTRLPPLPKSDYFFDNFNYKDAFDNDLSLTNNSGNTIRLMHCQSINLNLLLQILQDELYAISMMNTYSADQVNLKLIFRLIDLMFSSLFPSLVFLQKYGDHDRLDTKSNQETIFNIYHKLISADLRFTQNSLMWVCLINFASDICYFDLNYVPIFESLFKFLVNKTSSNTVLEDELVKSAFKFFFATFSNEDIVDGISGSASKIEMPTNSNLVTVEISYDEYKFMYPYPQQNPINSNPDGLRMDCLTTNDPYVNVSHTYLHMQDQAENKKPYNNTNNNDLLFIFEPEIANASTPLKSNYVTNFARQQSIHVDQYGRV
ncbi:uncharacterized protein AC631_03131 [Debaryomyces fabryi]|uniref:Uncharacterized protein n=1 Tax=Debaryomyces fabryi TaxID=58627 RepID=A0A0V1PY70_9ASCO|nr:uncharacterized protein AC631_03131 [Debaryomyces fabryi]KSA01126.1 hypothetical protein AC631_03131 [Debaryomyces fabryi]CUM55468.1 unnamed protein product [Debaryomyces fabryi]